MFHENLNCLNRSITQFCVVQSLLSSSCAAESSTEILLHNAYSSHDGIRTLTSAKNAVKMSRSSVFNDISLFTLDNPLSFLLKLTTF